MSAAVVLVDWLHPAMLDALWLRLMRWEDCVWPWSLRDPVPRRLVYLDLLLRIPCLCRTTRDLFHDLTLGTRQAALCNLVGWQLERSLWWPRLPRRNRWTAIYEFAVRRLVHDLQSACDRAGCQMAVAGGFAAWQLAHHDASQHWDVAAPRRSWTPTDIDLFLPASRFTANLRACILRAYRRFHRLIFAHAGEATHLDPVLFARQPWWMHTDDQAYTWGEADDDDGAPQTPSEHPPPRHVELLHAAVRSPSADVLEQTLRDAPARPRAYRLVSTYRLCGRMPVRRHDWYHPVPRELNLILTSDPPGRWKGTYASWVLQGFDLAHCAVAVRVCSSTGRWAYECDAEAHAALQQRKLRFRTRIFASERIFRATLERVLKYMTRGFHA